MMLLLFYLATSLIYKKSGKNLENPVRNHPKFYVDFLRQIGKKLLQRPLRK